MNQDRRAQILGQALLFVLGSIIFGMILLYGYRAISTLGAVREQVCVVDMQNLLKNQIERVSASVGTVRRLNLPMCAGYHTICFIDHRLIEGSSAGGANTYISTMITPPGRTNQMTRIAWLRMNQSAAMADAIRSGTDQNIFLKPTSETQLRVGPIEVEGQLGFMCIEDVEGSTVSLRLEGQGTSTLVTRWQEEE